MCVWKRYLRFFFITQIVNAVREGHDKRSPVGQIAAFSPAESVPTTREIEIEARVEAKFLELASKGNDKYFGQLFIYQKFDELRNLSFWTFSSFLL